ncbi:MAG TPA: hypothetical protein VMM13_19095, partial [Euzebya sp.]|nr:hypothetical protein [Euzebya sp.]
LGMPMLTWAVLLAVTASVPRSAPGSRALQALPAGTSWFLLTLLILSIVAQTGADAQAAPLAGWWIVAALAAGVTGTTLTATAIGPPPPLPARDRAPDPSAPRLPEEGDGALWWAGAAPTSTVMVVVLVAAGLALAWAASAWMLCMFLPIALLLAASSRARVTIGRERVVVSGGLAGWPRLSVPLVTVTEARATTTGIREWGGWGLRVRPGATGVITRAGEALELHRTDDTLVVITIEDAATAAAVVNTLLARA